MNNSSQFSRIMNISNYSNYSLIHRLVNLDVYSICCCFYLFDEYFSLQSPVITIITSERLRGELTIVFSFTVSLNSIKYFYGKKFINIYICCIIE